MQLISQLSSNDPFRNCPDAVLNEDSNSLEIEKPITDTGQIIESPTADEDEEGEFEEIEEEQEEEMNESDKDCQKELKTNLGPKVSDFETREDEGVKSFLKERRNDTENGETPACVDGICGKQKREQKGIRTCNNHPLILRELTTGHKYSRQ